MNILTTSYPAPPQERANWCWAAVSDYIAAAMSLAHGQCSIATKCLPSICNGLCQGALCDSVHALDDALIKVGHYKNYVDGSIPECRVFAEIDAGRPIGVRIQWSGSTLGHFVAIFGYLKIGNSYNYWIYDPADTGSLGAVSIHSLNHSYQTLGSWSHTYFTS